MHGTVTAQIEGNVGKLTFSSPKANSLDVAMLREFNRLIREVAANVDCKVIVVQSGGKTFCAGAALDQLQKLSSIEEATEFFALFGRITVALREVKQPVIIRMQGKAAGGGVGIVAAGDYVIGTPEAAVKLSEFEVGIGPMTISPILNWRLGEANTVALALSGEWKDSDWCLARGMISEIAAGEVELDKRVSELSAQIAKYSVSAVREFKGLYSTGILEEQIEERAKINAKILIESAAKAD